MPRQTAYTRVAEALRGAILDGRYRSGQQLPTESELCHDFSTSRITIRQALRILEEALVRRRQGRGTFVNSAATRRIPILNADFYGSVTRHAPDLERRLLEMDWVEAPESAAEALDVCPGEPLLRAVRVDILRDLPIATDIAWFVSRFARRLTRKDLEALDLLECWQRRETIESHYGSQFIDVIKARAPVAGRLKIRNGAPLLREVNVKGARIQDARHPLNGALAGSALTMDAGIRNLSRWLGIPAAGVWEMGTRTPARILGLKNKGIIRVGADADLVLWDEDLRARRTWVGGRWVFERSD